MEEVSNAIPEEGSQTPDQETVPEIVHRISPTADDISQCPNAVQNLESCNWEQLQEKFVEAMEAHARTEEGLQEQTAQLLGVFMAWSQVTVARDEDRAFKRFKTRMQHVQNSEKKLEDKRKHYANVVKAFESALAMLND
ncbi:hypothetical protein VTN02DRAFT_2010 [Thermoascus thermophilus]